MPPEPLGCRCELAIVHQGGAEAKERVRMTRRIGERLREGELGVRAVPAIEENAAQHHRPFRQGGAISSASPQHGFRFGEPAQREKQHPELVKGERKSRLPHRGALEPFHRLDRAPALPQGDGKMRLDHGVGSGASGLLERRDRLARSPLRQQREPKNVQGGRVARVSREQSAGDAFGFIRPAVLDGGHGPARAFVGRRRVRGASFRDLVLLLHRRSPAQLARVQVLVLQMMPPRIQPCTLMVFAFCKVTLAA